MPPFSSSTAASSGRRGGKSRSPKKLAALAELHKSRRGVRVNDPGPQWGHLKADLLNALREPVRGVRSTRVLAEECGVSDRAVRRWLSGDDMPSAERVRIMRRWLRRAAAVSPKIELHPRR